MSQKPPCGFFCKERTSQCRISWDWLHWTVSVCSGMDSCLVSGSGYDAEELTELCQPVE